MVKELFDQLAAQENQREILSRIREAIRDEKEYRAARKIAENGSVLEELLDSPDAKARKNAAALIGDLEIVQAAPALFCAYKKEETLFVRATLLKALEKTNPYPYLQELKDQYELLEAKETPDDEKKHVREEMHALGRILRKTGNETRHIFTGWNEKFTILLTTNSKYAYVTANQVHAYRKRITPPGVQAVVDDLEDVLQIRTFRELLFPIRLEKPVTRKDGPKILGEAVVHSQFPDLLKRCHRGKSPFYFRIDISAKFPLEERSRYIKRAAAVIEEESAGKLVNAPENYEFELRLLFDKEEKIHVFLKMHTIPMERFSYRKESISTSIHPSTAALLMELAKPYLTERAHVLDPCCGVGTMLVERHKQLSAGEMYALDIFGEAVEKSRINMTRARMRANVIQKNYFEFRNAFSFDEIIANMPVAGKRTKTEQDFFYEKFFRKSAELLMPGGVMILYSNELGFVKKQLRLHPEFQLRKEYLIREKDQFWLFIIVYR